ncbi:hypothetical protein [Microcoleus sp. N3A4]
MNHVAGILDALGHSAGGWISRIYLGEKPIGDKLRQSDFCQ